ncbi:MAG: Tn3 family transposase [Solirubrobacteraceae bacterium]
MLSDQAVGLAAKVVSGAPRDSLHMIDVAFSQDQGQRPEVLVADTTPGWRTNSARSGWS